MQQRDARRAIGIVLDRRDLGRNAVLVALEIDFTKGLLMAAAYEARRNVPVAAASTSLTLAERERLFGGLLGDFLTRHQRHKPAAGRCGTEFFERHGVRSPRTPASSRR